MAQVSLWVTIADERHWLALILVVLRGALPGAKSGQGERLRIKQRGTRPHLSRPGYYLPRPLVPAIAAADRTAMILDR